MEGLVISSQTLFSRVAYWPRAHSGRRHQARAAVCPGFVGTDWFRNALGEEMFDRIVDGQKKSTPMHRAGTPEDISGPILFFANRASAHVTGQLLVVDAGLLLGMPVKIG